MSADDSTVVSNDCEMAEISAEDITQSNPTVSHPEDKQDADESNINKVDNIIKDDCGAGAATSEDVYQKENAPSKYVDTKTAEMDAVLTKSDNETDSKSVPFKKPMFITPPNLPTPKKPTTNLSTSADEKSSHQPQKVSKNLPKPPKSESKMNYLSPAEKLKHAQTSVPYKEPAWGGLCETQYYFEVLKNGTIIDTINLTDKPFYVFGRLPSCDVSMDHLSLSRHHAIVQHSVQKTDNHDIGWYLYDLDSTHGTWINKNKVQPRIYNRIRVGHVIKFGGSSRLYVLQGPDEDQDTESELTVTELKLQREKQKAQAELLKQATLDEMENMKQKAQRESTCMWGMSDDVIEENEESEEVNPFAITEESELTFEDPKKELKKYFEREGHEMPEYEFLAAGYGKHHCRIELPVDTPSGHPMVAESMVSGKKKDSVVACAMEALRILDRLGELRKSSHESKKRKKKNWEDDDFYDSDEDTFLDRTGVIEQKRLERMKKAGKGNEAVETYDSLVDKLKVIGTEISDITKQLENAKQANLESDDVDDLDAYMSSLKSGAMDKRTRMKLKSQIFELKQQEQKLRRLANIAKPASLPEIVKLDKKATVLKTASPSKGALPLTGKIRMKGPSIKPNIKQPTDPEYQLSEQEIEEDEEDNETEMTKDETTTTTTTTAENSSTEIEKPKSYGLIKPSDIRQEEKQETIAVEKTIQKSNSEKSAQSQIDTTRTVNNDLHNKRQKTVENPSNLDTSAEMKSFPIKRKADTVSKFKKMKKPQYDELTDDPNYAVWMPPTDQTGDGRTKLNEKFGY